MLPRSIVMRMLGQHTHLAKKNLKRYTTPTPAFIYSLSLPLSAPQRISLPCALFQISITNFWEGTNIWALLLLKNPQVQYLRHLIMLAKILVDLDDTEKTSYH